MRLPLLAPLALSLLLTACATTRPVNQAQLAALSPQMTAADVERTLGDATPLLSFEMPYGAQRAAVRQFNVVVGSRTEMMTVCTPNCMVIPTQVAVTAPLVVMQGLPERRLLAWGTLEQLSKDASPEQNAVATEVRARMAAAAK
ncbi:MAG: hypothetical protein DI603_08400 [Roseateles depolymerans]|uniref:Lipoprotein n=1 Tax=Roseateles depolymerans TaxID=76731 RepID=A0A2W5DNM9_9BURK|nr:MAG: hypothetical protein DI603_08400 [Roseateles depolymerans]